MLTSVLNASYPLSLDLLSPLLPIKERYPNSVSLEVEALSGLSRRYESGYEAVLRYNVVMALALTNVARESSEMAEAGIETSVRAALSEFVADRSFLEELSATSGTRQP